MIKKTYLNSLLAGLGLFAVVTSGQAATISCTGASYDISTKVDGASDCLILSPLDGAVNDSVSPPASSYTVNTESFFGKNIWQFDGRFDVTEQTNSSNFFNFSGAGQSGGYGFIGADASIQFMFVMKDGANTNLVAYLLSTPVASGTNTYSTPFTAPPFSLSGQSTSKDISHISVYYLSDPGGSGNQIPEPGTIAILGMGLLGMGLVSRHRKNGLY
ncbi:PEP-CTERM sorting domain-containing protein [Noviherbaspirillum soli]|uniref:PEP-CTERM sorting domain-containing protein n=1 Tax=Noviherbaspirillum soli TaxID=1064518 RepID=UPI00188C379E|nr:PEP-CTERM sorting domain-containing protein [Noviherbaspirillum soli]